MKQSITKRELRQIRKEIEAVQGRYDTGSILYAAVALPNGYDDETLMLAHRLVMGLRNVDCEAHINFVLSYPRDLTCSKWYEVLPYIPIGSPCIRVYPRQNIKREKRLEKVKSKLKEWWHRLWLNKEELTT